jgi:hypothetical protein
MNMFFQAFTQQEIDAMDKDNALIDEWIWENPRYSAATDVETAWDILMTLLGGVGFPDGSYIDDVLSNGCSLISADSVKDQAQKLSNWTPEKVLVGLRSLANTEDLYHLKFFQENEDSLLEQFDKLVAFYKEAAEKELGVTFYPA